MIPRQRPPPPPSSAEGRQRHFRDRQTDFRGRQRTGRGTSEAVRGQAEGLQRPSEYRQRDFRGRQRDFRSCQSSRGASAAVICSSNRQQTIGHICAGAEIKESALFCSCREECAPSCAAHPRATGGGLAGHRLPVVMKLGLPLTSTVTTNCAALSLWK